MTVPYAYQGRGWPIIRDLKLILRWRGSLYKLLWKHVIALAILYLVYYLLVVYVINEEWKIHLRLYSKTCSETLSYIPISLVLSFYVERAQVRFFEQFNNIPWPHRLAQYVSVYVRSSDEAGRMVRRTIMRYVCLAIVMSISGISTQAARRFPTLKHLRNAGFLVPAEMKTLKSITASGNKYVIPLTWANNMILMSRKSGWIKCDLGMLKMLEEIVAIRRQCALVLSFDLYTIPLVYTQIVMLSTYLYLITMFLSSLDWNTGNPVRDLFAILSNLMYYALYLGWLKVAEQVTNPFGEEDDDFDVNVLIDRFLHESYMIVDDLYDQLPEILTDIHVGDPHVYIPYTLASKKFDRQSPFEAFFKQSAINPVLGRITNLSKAKRGLKAISIRKAKASLIPKDELEKEIEIKVSEDSEAIQTKPEAVAALYEDILKQLAELRNSNPSKYSKSDDD